MTNQSFSEWVTIPSWGSLPIEQYLIRNWNHTSTDAPSQQRRRLIHGFLELSEIPQECIDLHEYPTRTPTPEEIDTILEPWRPDDNLRRKAYYLSKDNVLVFLRTHYKPEDDGKMNEWAYETDLFEDNPCWICLNDPRLFNFGSDWRRVYEIMPEIARAVDRTLRIPEPSELGNIPGSFKAGIHANKQSSPLEWTQNRVNMTKASAKRLQNISRVAYIVIADQEAFQTGQLRLLCLNDQRNIVREVRLDQKPVEITGLISHWGSLLETYGETISVDKYRAYGI